MTDTATIGIEKRARGRVVAQQRYLERQRRSKEQQVERIIGQLEAILRTEIALADLLNPRLTKAQRRRIYTEVCRRARVVLLG